MTEVSGLATKIDVWKFAGTGLRNVLYPGAQEVDFFMLNGERHHQKNAHLFSIGPCM